MNVIEIMRDQAMLFRAKATALEDTMKILEADDVPAPVLNGHAHKPEKPKTKTAQVEEWVKETKGVGITIAQVFDLGKAEWGKSFTRPVARVNLWNLVQRKVVKKVEDRYFAV